ncbi:MAG: DUF4405 domain-containing protein [Paracoccus sp. (in: a-proteobacteria)]|uniref:DUF4405 domain-containing protein n=1 Tax=Paracoccus sp. TaxID=267 RepID=UPI0026E10098|nr:DUF4405 domain-containing protein [Paracoccus sp. (in: a-proteobacteria)]MDO5621276.1 DUF4405 domain-containing protein [Paracoccus sp. (in: a-proteobacteria)]
MLSFFNRYATPFTTGLFTVSLISGVALFFHIGPAGLHGMHEWLSMVLILPIALHVWRNWRAFGNYFRYVPMRTALLVSAVLAGLFLIPTGESGRSGPPQFTLARQLMAAPVTVVAPALGSSTEDLTARLKAAGITLATPDQPLATPDQPLAEAAAAAGKSEMALAAALTAE